MFVEPITYDDLPRLEGKAVCVFGAGKRAEHLAAHIRQSGLDITIKFFLGEQAALSLCGLPVYTFEAYVAWHDLSREVIVIAADAIMPALEHFIDHEPAELYICSRDTAAAFSPPSRKDASRQRHTAEKSVLPFMMESGTPRVPAIVSNAYEEPHATVYEIADFMRAEYTIYRCPKPAIPISLRDFSSRIPQNTLPMRMSHLGYLYWKRSTHVEQLSYGRKFLVAPRYNFFHLDIVNLETKEIIHWHDKDPSEGLWDYVATGDFSDTEEAFYFVRWPLEDAIRGMNDGSNKVRCEVGKLDLNTMQAEILGGFTFIDRIHQITISGDGRYVVFAPMRVLRPKINPRFLREEDIMPHLREWTVLDDMGTLDLSTGTVRHTRIPYPVPAHFELDPVDPHLFYVSTHSLMPYRDGVICFNPGTLHKLRITDGESHIEATYSHPGFVRTTVHCVFLHRGRTLIAATNQNKVEIVDAADMTQLHVHKLADDPFYDTADFNNPDFSSRPFTLPGQPAYCGAISASGDGEYLILRMPDRFLLYSVADRSIAGSVLFREKRGSLSSHSRFYMQNAPQDLMDKKYATLWKDGHSPVPA